MKLYAKLKPFCALFEANYLKAGHRNNLFVKRGLITSENYVAEGCEIPA